MWNFRETLKVETLHFHLGIKAILKGVRNTKGIQREYAARRGDFMVLGGHPLKDLNASISFINFLWPRYMAKAPAKRFFPIKNLFFFYHPGRRQGT